MFWWKPGILIPDLYLYGIKIQTNIKQNSVEKYAGKSQIFINIFLNFFMGLDPAQSFWAGAVLSSSVNSGEALHCSHRTVEEGTEEEEVEKEEEEGRGADLRWLWGDDVGGCWPENGLAGGWSFFFFSAYFSFVLLLSVFVFFFYFSWCRCYYRRRGGQWQLAVALVVAMWTVDGGSSSFLFYFLFSSSLSSGFLSLFCSISLLSLWFYWRSLTVLLMVSGRKPTMVHGGYCSGGQCLLHFFSSSS